MQAVQAGVCGGAPSRVSRVVCLTKSATQHQTLFALQSLPYTSSALLEMTASMSSSRQHQRRATPSLYEQAATTNGVCASLVTSVNVGGTTGECHGGGEDISANLPECTAVTKLCGRVSGLSSGTLYSITVSVDPTLPQPAWSDPVYGTPGLSGLSDTLPELSTRRRLQSFGGLNNDDIRQVIRDFVNHRWVSSYMIALWPVI